MSEDLRVVTAKARWKDQSWRLALCVVLFVGVAFINRGPAAPKDSRWMWVSFFSVITALQGWKAVRAWGVWHGAGHE